MNISTGKEHFQVGKKIGIFYKKSNPQNFILDDFSIKWFGVIACAIAIFLLWSSALCCWVIEAITRKITDK